MQYTKLVRLLVYSGIIFFIFACLYQDASGFRVKKKPYAKLKSKGEFRGHHYGRTGIKTFQSRRDRKNSNTKETNPRSLNKKPELKPVAKDTAKMSGGLIKEPKSRKQISLKPIPVIKLPPINKKKPKPKKPKGGSREKVNTCPKEFIRMNCLSCKTKVYRKCPIVGASKVTSIHIEDEYPSSLGRCYVGNKQNFGKNDTYIWVDKGCRAKFVACYNRAIKEPKNVGCSCAKGEKWKHRCPIGLYGSDIVIKVVVLWSFGQGKCREGKTWGYDDRRVWVEDGCSAQFKIFWS